MRKLIAVHRKGADYIYAHRDEAMQIYAKVWQQNPKDVATYFPKYFDYRGEWSPGGFDTEALTKMSDGLQLTGESSGPVDWKSAIDPQYLPDDLRKPL